MLRVDVINSDAYVDAQCECRIRSSHKITEMRSDMASFIKNLRNELKETNSAILPEGIRASDLVEIRDYFEKHDKTPFEHRSYTILDKIINKF